MFEELEPRLVGLWLEAAGMEFYYWWEERGAFCLVLVPWRLMPVCVMLFEMEEAPCCSCRPCFPLVLEAYVAAAR